MRFAVCGAAPASAELLTRFEARYGFPLIEGYGLSEGTCGSTINPVAGPRRAGTVGPALPGQEMRIVDASGARARPGCDGEVVVRGPNVMRGYLGRPDDTARVIIDGWLHTGDVGHLDADGYLTLVGRSKDMIIRGGENIYPKEIEDVLAGDPRCSRPRSSAYPTRSGARSSSPTSNHDRPRPSTRLPEGPVCADLSGYKRPTAYVVVDAIPKNAVGKIDKAPLRAAQAAGALR